MKKNPFELNLTLNLEDLYDEEGSESQGEYMTCASDLLKTAIVEGVEYEIKKMFKKDIDNAISESIETILKNLAKSKFNVMLEKKIKNKLLDLKVKKRYSGEMVSVEEAIIVDVASKVNSLTENHISQLISKNVKTEVEKLQQRYDQEYAISIIKSLADGGFLSSKASALLVKRD